MSHLEPGTKTIDFEGAFARLSPDEQVVIEYLVSAGKSFDAMDDVEQSVWARFADMSQLEIVVGITGEPSNKSMDLTELIQG